MAPAQGWHAQIEKCIKFWGFIVWTSWATRLQGYSAQITYKEKTAPAKTWAQLNSDPALPPSILNNLFSTWDVGLEIATIVRRFLLATPLPKLSQIPELDPVRFQSLDRAFVNAKWLPSILSLQAYQSAGFPSDHYPLELVPRQTSAAQSKTS